MNPVLLTINTISALITIASAVLAMYRPGLMVHASSVDANTRFYVYMYAVRAIPVGLAVLITPLLFSRRCRRPASCNFCGHTGG